MHTLLLQPLLLLNDHGFRVELILLIQIVVLHLIGVIVDYIVVVAVLVHVVEATEVSKVVLVVIIDDPHVVPIVVQAIHTIVVPNAV